MPRVDHEHSNHKFTLAHHCKGASPDVWMLSTGPDMLAEGEKALWWHGRPVEMAVQFHAKAIELGSNCASGSTELEALSVAGIRTPNDWLNPALGRWPKIARSGALHKEKDDVEMA